MTDKANDTAKPSKAPSDADRDLLSVARKRLDVAAAAYSDSRNDELDDLRFAAGSPDNNWQWPADVIAGRTSTGDALSARPTLTINKLPQHIKQVTNDQRQNRPSGEVIPTNGDADVEVAEVYNGMVRHIEYISDADVAYDTACENQVTFGEGYWRLITKYTDDDSFEQDIFIVRIRNSFSVYMDPMIQDPCGQDAMWAWIREQLTKEEYEDQYPNAMPISSLREAGVGDSSMSAWLDNDIIQIGEYFYVEMTHVKLHLFKDNYTAFEGSTEFDVYSKNLGEPIKSRMAERRQVKWIKTNGYEILERRDWPGKYIPIIRVIGNEFEIDGQIYISGIVRNAKDPQRMYNYWVSQEAEMLALAPKAPFIGYAGQFEGYEHQWKTANTNAWPYLEVNAEVTDTDGRMAPLPQRAMPPMAQHGLIAAKEGAAEDIKNATGQYNASLGQQSNERSGKAILARQHEGDVSTFHYGDNLARAVRYSTRQIVQLIPLIYDTERVARIIGEDGKSSMVKIDPSQTEAVVKKTDPNNPDIVIEKIYNPSVGKYDVTVVTGPGYATKRQQALDAMSQLLQGNPELWAKAGDLFVKNMDWPGSQELSKRLAKAIDPRLTADEDTSPALQQAIQQNQELQQHLQQAMQMLQNVPKSIEHQELEIKKEEVRIKAYAAETDRIKVTQAPMDPNQIADLAAPEQPEVDPNAPPPMDPNKVMLEQSKHALQGQQHAHEANMAQLQAGHAQEAAQAQQQAPAAPGGKQ